MWNQEPSFRFEIDNFSEKEAAIASPTFVSGGCEWFLNVYPKGDSRCDDHLALYLYVANSKSLGMGWKRSAYYYFVVLNQSDKELSKSFVQQYSVFREKSRGWGLRKALPLRKLQEKGCLEKDRLIIEVYIKVVEAFDGEGRDVPEKKETLDINGFQIFASQVTLARKIFAEHPDIAEDFKPKNKVVKTEYMNVLLNLIETLDKLSKNHSETELNNAYSELNELMEEGFKLDWLKSKLDGVSLKSKKADGDGFHVQQLEQGVKTIELMELERKKSDDADGSRFQQLEERVKNLELMVSDLKTELDKEKGKSFADDFLLVD